MTRTEAEVQDGAVEEEEDTVEEEEVCAVEERREDGSPPRLPIPTRPPPLTRLELPSMLCPPELLLGFVSPLLWQLLLLLLMLSDFLCGR